MKWARPLTSIKTTSQTGKPGTLSLAAIATRKKYIEVIDVSSIENLRKKGFREWLICSSKKDWEIIKDFSADDRFSYEAYVGGFLAYYEIHISKTKRKENRTVYFDWARFNPNVPLTIYLKPVNSPYYDDKGKPIKKTKTAINTGWTADKRMRSPLAPPPAGLQTDPPIPPVPPPPPPRFNEQQ